ncbi:MAG: hypothetical protein AAFW95_08245 [Cyanobacteria bacterium J06638_6]
MVLFGLTEPAQQAFIATLTAHINAPFARPETEVSHYPPEFEEQWQSTGRDYWLVDSG